MNMSVAVGGAYYRGICNGVKGIWDGGKMLVTETDKVLEGIYQSGSEFLEAPLKNTWEFLGDIKDGFIDSVWRSTPQEIAEDAGELAFDVAISVPTGGAGKVVSGAAKGIGKIKYLDNLVDIGKISQKIPSLQGMPLPAGGVLPFNLADDFLKAPYQMIKPDGEDVAKLTAKGDDVVKQGAKEVKKPDTIDSQKVIKEKSGKETGSGVQITDSVNKTEVKDIVEKTEVKNTAEETKVKKKIDSEGGSESQKVLGGSFKDVDASRGDGEVGHHLPQNAYNVKELGMTRNEGPALLMTKEDHALTRTYRGRGKQTLISDKRLNARQRMVLDIINIRENFGTKYNEGLLEAIKYAKMLPQFQK